MAHASTHATSTRFASRASTSGRRLGVGVGGGLERRLADGLDLVGLGDGVATAERGAWTERLQLGLLAAELGSGQAQLPAQQVAEPLLLAEALGARLANAPARQLTGARAQGAHLALQ